MTSLQKRRVEFVLVMSIILVVSILGLWFGWSYAEVLIKNLSGADYSHWNLLILIGKIMTGI